MPPGADQRNLPELSNITIEETWRLWVTRVCGMYNCMFPMTVRVLLPASFKIMREPSASPAERII